MGTPALEKQLSESRIYTMDFSANLDAAEVLDAIVSLDVLPAVTSPALVIASQTIPAAGKTVTFRISGGAVGSYKITVKAHTSLGNQLEGDGVLKVVDR